MGNCKDCKHWDARCSMCEGVDWIDGYEDDLTIPCKGDMFAVYVDAPDDQGLSVHLKTGPLFGCVKFQPKPQEGS